MTIFVTSNHIALAAIAGGIFSAFLISAIEDLLDKFIYRTQEIEIKTILIKGLISSFTVGLLLSIIFYAFAVYGFPDKEFTPIQLITIFTLFFGFGYPLIGVTLKSIRSNQ